MNRLERIKATAYNYGPGPNIFGSDDVKFLLRIAECAEDLNKSVGTLIGDFKADDEEPTHYTAWFWILDEQQKLKKALQGEMED